MKRLAPSPWLRLVSMLLLLAWATGCASMGPKKLVSSHQGYNSAVQLAVTREVLTNIVRARYADPMQFLAVSTVNAQFSVSVGGSGNVGGMGTGSPAGGVTGNVGYSESPTMTFIPQSDAAFYKSLYSPMELLETVGMGFLYKTDGDEYIKLLFGAINGASDRDGGKLYQQRIRAIWRLRKLGAYLQMRNDWIRLKDTALPKSQIGGEGYAMGVSEGRFWLDTEDGKSARLVERTIIPVLVVSNAKDPEVIQALKDLGVKPGRERYPFRTLNHSRPGFDDPFAIWTSPRSVQDILRVSALQVEVPDAHQKIVPSLERFRQGLNLELPFRIQSSQAMPGFPYRIEHRGHWFYVDDTDVESRIFLDLVVRLYSSRVGSRSATDLEPQLVIPIGTGN